MNKKKILKINGIWGLVNFYVDENLSHLRLADASLKSPDGSTMQQIYKICQSPFVEVIADTFVDKYNFIIRRPPFTIEEISKQNFLVIGRECSIQDSLEFSREVYTVYQLIPHGGCFSDNSSIALSYLPMVVLDDYSRLWGNKLYSQVYNYIDIDTFNQLNNEKGEIKPAKEIFIEALSWLIETTAYLPFSRTGQITIKGDRRIKVGQWIYYEKTNEVFYVNSVNHSASIMSGEVNRVTTLNVSRGLVKDYIKAVTKKENFWESNRINYDWTSKEKQEVQKIDISNVSYADLVDIGLLKEGLKEMSIKMNKGVSKQKLIKEENNFQSNSSLVNSEVFDFFLKGKQFEGKIHPYSLYYGKPAMTLQEINNEQGGGNGNGSGYNLSITQEEKEEIEYVSPKFNSFGGNKILNLPPDFTLNKGAEGKGINPKFVSLNK